MNELKNYFSSRVSPDQFTVFAILYMVPVVHELGDPWWSWGGQGAPLLFQGLILAVIVFIAMNLSLGSFLVFAAISAAYYIVSSFPEIPNHITLLVFCNIAILISLPVLMLLKRPDQCGDEVFASLKPVMRLMLITLFFVAGFHKLNTDFLNPEVSCVNFVVGLFEGRIFRQIFGIPFVFYIAPVLVAAMYWLVRSSRRINVSVSVSGWAFLVTLALVVAAGAYLSSGDLRSTIIGAGAVTTLLWQLVEGPLLFVRRLQAPILLLSLVLLGTIAMSGVPMFPAVLLPLLFTFVPDNVFLWWRNKSILRVGDWKVHSIHIFFFLNLLGASLVYINESMGTSPQTGMITLAVSQMFFLASVLLLLMPILLAVLSGERDWKWEGVQVWSGTTPRIFLFFPIMLLLLGMTPYLGLRTTGNFSMFSNVRVEGPTSNHILLGDNPIKIWGYQEDRVRIIDIDEQAAKIGHHYDPLGGNSIPVVEFRKMVTMWKESGNEIAMTYEYQSGPVTTQDIANDANWDSAGRNWETFWLDFRPVQESGPNMCRW